MLNQDAVLHALRAVKYPGYSRDIVSFGLVKEAGVDQGAVSVSLQLTSPSPQVARQLQTECEQALQGIPGVRQVHVQVHQPPAAVGPAAGPWAQQNRVPGLQRILAIASGKGGVGKSTLSVNLACARQQLGARVGLLDCDIYGPSIPLMMGIHERPTVSPEEKLVPPASHGVKLMSMGFLLADDSPVIVRGPMATRYTQQFLRQCAWDNLDYLVLDLPPGTGDIQLTVVQTVALSGTVIVTTPQEVALIDARKAVAMFAKVNVPVIGLIENMSHFVCPNDGNVYHIFGKGGGEREAAKMGVPLLGQIPLEIQVRESGDAGHPVALEDPGKHPASSAFQSIARQIIQIIAARDAGA